MPDPVLIIERLTKSYGRKKVLYGLDLSVSKGEIVAFLGVNGAGKTTTINIMLGLERPTTGNVQIMGGSPLAPKTRQHIGCTPQETSFPTLLTVRELVEFIGEHYPKRHSPDTILDIFGLSGIADQRTGGLSGGQKRRLAVALAFVGEPTIVFLDEPTTGLDVEARRDIWQGAREYAQRGGTIFLTTHYIEEAEALATRVVILQKGKILTEGPVSTLIGHSSQATVSFKSSTSPPEPLHFAQHIERNGDDYKILSDNPDELIRTLVKQGVPFSGLKIEKPGLEAAFLKLTGQCR